LKSLVDGWTVFSSLGWLWVFVLYFALYQATVLAPLFVLGPLIAQRSLGGASGWAVIVSATGMGAVVGGLLAMRIKPRRPLVFGCYLSFLDIPQLVFLANEGPLGAIVVSGFIAGVVLTLFDTIWVTVLQTHVPAEVQARVAAYDWIGSICALPIGYALVGPVSAALGVSITFRASAIGIVFSTLVVLLVPSVRSLHRRSAAPPAPKTVGT
jgi:hypothetical protein